MTKNKVGTTIEIIGAAVLVVFGLIITICQLIEASDKYASIITLIVYFTTIIYLCFDYKIPHGNLLKYLFILFATALALIVCRPDEFQLVAKYLFCAPMILAAFMAGRLNRMKDNMAYMIIIEAILIVGALISLFGTAAPPADGQFVPEMSGAWYSRLMVLNPAIQFGTLALTYIARFNAHKEAGEQTPAEES